MSLYNCDYCQTMPNGTDSSKNTLYPYLKVCKTVSDYYEVFKKDFVVGRFENNTRNLANLRVLYGITLDNDNTHSDNPTDWIQATDWNEDKQLRTGHINPLYGVKKIIYPSRNNMKAKGDKAPRPKHHIILPFSEPWEAPDPSALGMHFEPIEGRVNALLDRIWSYLMFTDKCCILDTKVKPWGFIYGNNNLKLEEVLFYE